MIARLLAALKVLVQRETLGSPGEALSGRQRKTLLSLVFAPETLPPPPADQPPRSPSLATFLFGREELPHDAASPARTAESFAGWLLKPEPLPPPATPPAGGGHPGLFGWLTAREELPREDPPAKRRRSRRTRGGAA